MEIFYVLPDYYESRPKPCLNGWGQRYLTVNPIGDVLPCPTASSAIPDLRFENVRARDLDWIWRESESFTRFRGTEWMPEPCRSCPQREIDFGGCRWCRRDGDCRRGCRRSSRSWRCTRRSRRRRRAPSKKVAPGDVNRVNAPALIDASVVAGHPPAKSAQRLNRREVHHGRDEAFRVAAPSLTASNWTTPIRADCAVVTAHHEAT